MGLALKGLRYLIKSPLSIILRNDLILSKYMCLYVLQVFIRVFNVYKSYWKAHLFAVAGVELLRSVVLAKFILQRTLCVW